MNRRKLRRRTEHAAKLYSKWATRRMLDQMLERYQEETFARWRADWPFFSPIDAIRYGYHAYSVDRRFTLSVLNTAAA